MAATKWALAAICVILSLSCLVSCTGPQIPPASALSATLPSSAGLAEATATVARKQNWDCQRIKRAIANLVAAMQAAKARAEAEQEQMAQTLALLFERLSGPPGAGNAALAEFQDARRDADQLNDLLGEKGCATYHIGVDAPTFLRR